MWFWRKRKKKSHKEQLTRKDFVPCMTLELRQAAGIEYEQDLEFLQKLRGKGSGAARVESSGIPGSEEQAKS